MGEERLAEKQLSRVRFIRLGAALGVGAAGASVIAACGGGSGDSGGGGGGGADDSGSSGGETSQAPAETTQAAEGGGESGSGQVEGAIASEADVAPGSAVTFEEAGRPAVLVHLDTGDFVAYSAICTHQQCTVAYNNGQLACPCHGSVFDPANAGAVVNGPAQTPLPEIPVQVQDGQVVRA